MSSIDTCWNCGESEIETIERVAQLIQQRHDDGSIGGKEWTNHHGLDRCDCDELVQFIRNWYNLLGGLNDNDKSLN